MHNNLTSDERMDAYYKLRHAIQYLSAKLPFLEYLPNERLLLPLANELRQPFADAGVFKAR